MRSTIDILRSLVFGILTLGALARASPADAQWTRVTAVPVIPLFSLAANADTLAAGADTAVYLSTDAGASWRRSAKPAAGVAAITAVLFRSGRLYAGTFGQGAFISDDLGASWSGFNQGLVGGIADSQLYPVDFQVRGDSLCAATAGAGVWVRRFTTPSAWQSFGAVFEPNQASNVNSLALGGSRLMAMAGSNGTVFTRDPGDVDWAISSLDNLGLHPGMQATTAAWTGAGWVVGTNGGVFRSVAGQEPRTPSGPDLGPLDWASFATNGPHLFAAFDIPNLAVIEESDDDGASWRSEEDLPHVFVQDLAISGDHLFAARGDGLWRRPTATLSAPVAGAGGGLRFVLVGQPCRDLARVRFVLPEAGTSSIEVFDVLGRVVGDRVEGRWSSGPHEVSLDTRHLSPGVYTARLTAGGGHEGVRLIRVR